MRMQSPWLFEPPAPNLSLYANSFADQAHYKRLETEWEVQPNSYESAAPYSSSEYYFNPELEEKYRRFNKRFRREVANTIGKVVNHPLQFLIKQGQKGKWIFRTAKDRRVDAGHVTPVVTLRKRGHTTERLAIQDRTLNRSDGARMGVAGKGKRIKVVNVGGIPVDIDTVRKYAQMKLLNQAWLRAKPHKGWKAPGNKELEFALGEFHDWVSLPDPRSEAEDEWNEALFMDFPDIPTSAIPGDVKQSMATTLRAVAQLVLPAVQARSLPMLMNTALFLISPETWSRMNAAQQRAIAKQSLMLAAKQLGMQPGTTSKLNQRGFSSTQVKQNYRRQTQRGRQPGSAPLQRRR